MKWASEEKNSW